MKPIRSIFPSLIAIALTTTSYGAQAKCQLDRLKLRSGNEHISIGVLSLGEANDPEEPSAWQGPLRIDQCSFDVGIIEQPLIVAGDRYLIVSLYSGSTRQIVMVDPVSCSTKWKSIFFTSPPEMDANTLLIDGVRFELDDNCTPGKNMDLFGKSK